MISSPVLVLNQNYEPLNICTVRRAVVLLGVGKAETLENAEGEISTALLRHSHSIGDTADVPDQTARPCSAGCLAERFSCGTSITCLYCGRETKQLTLDHVVPRYRGGAHTWENVVSACITCNHRKAGRTPQEAGMRLAEEPRPPRLNPYSLFLHKPIREGWDKFVPWLAK